MTTIVVGVDGTENGLQALRWAVAEARVRDSVLRVVTSWELPAYAALPVTATPLPVVDPTYLSSVSKEINDHTIGAVDVDGLRVERVVTEGNAAHVLVEASKDADLVVVGAGRHGLGRLLGSVAHRVVNHAHCPVVVVPEGESS